MGRQMERCTISLDEELAAEFDRLMALCGYVNRSEAVHDWPCASSARRAGDRRTRT
jgi:metal-responsive CopG/Arc/MetJ family transcriptional regulator